MSTLAVNAAIVTESYEVLDCVCSPALFTDGVITWRVHDDQRLGVPEAEVTAAQLGVSLSVDGETPASGDVRLYQGVPEDWTAVEG